MQLNQITQLAVVGLGRMGHGIAQTFALAGYPVRGYDESPAVRRSVMDRIRANLEDFAANELLDAANVDDILRRITITDDECQAAMDADFIVEAIVEEQIAKREFFQRIENYVADEAIIASNSSTFTVSESCVDMRLPRRAIITHWFNPPHIVPTVEIVPGPSTAETVTETTVALHKKIGKLAVRINGEIPGFLVNRVQIAMIREVWDMYERGIASPQDIDAAIRGSLGFRLATYGPLAICDFGGVDIWSTVYKRLVGDLRNDSDVPTAIERLVDAGRCGTRTSAGIHDYESDCMDELVSQRDKSMLKLARLLQDEQDDDAQAQKH